MGGGLNADQVRDNFANAKPQEMIRYLETTGLLDQAGIFREILRDNPTGMEEFERLLSELQSKGMPVPAPSV